MIYGEMDRFLTGEAPTVTVPVDGEFVPLEAQGQRFLVAANGLWVEVCSPWGYVLAPYAVADHARCPYGTLASALRFDFGRFPQDMVERFMDDAASAGNCEIAAGIVWNSASRELSYRRPEVVSASAGHVRFRPLALADGETLVADLHSHGHGEPFFSGADDADDAGAIKIAGVCGYVGKRQSLLMRVCVLGANLPLKPYTREVQ